MTKAKAPNRGNAPPVCLPRERFQPNPQVQAGNCLYCIGKDGTPGLVKMGRDMVTFRLRPDLCQCLLCGQRYYVRREDLERFIGWPLSQDDFEAAYGPYLRKPRFRSIDDEWGPS